MQLERMPIFKEHYLLPFERNVLLHRRNADNRPMGEEPEKEEK
jgi:hypothetical protein